MRRNVLVVAAHPDDEILGVGATAARHADEGDEVHVLILAEGATSRGPLGAGARDARAHAAELDALRAAAGAAAEVLGTRPPRFAGLPDNRMDSLDLLDVVKAVEAVVAEVRPSVVYTHHGGDLNVDHLVTHRAVLTACRPLPGGGGPEAVYTFETLSSTEWGSPDQEVAFRPTRHVEVSAQLARKLDALRCYAGEMRPFPHARSIEAVEALARLRGAQSGLPAAEAFGVVREVVRAARPLAPRE